MASIENKRAGKIVQNFSHIENRADVNLTSLKAVAEADAAPQKALISCPVSSLPTLQNRHTFSESLAFKILPIKQGISHEVDEMANMNVEQSQSQKQKNLRSLTQESHEYNVAPTASMTISNPSHQQQHLRHSLPQTSGSNMELDGSSLMTSMINTNLESLAICNEKISAEQVSKEEKNEFLIFTRVLMRYLERKDPVMHGRAKLVIQECAEKGKKKEKGYESVTTALKKRLRETVGERYWARAEVYLKHFERKFRDIKPAT